MRVLFGRGSGHISGSAFSFPIRCTPYEIESANTLCLWFPGTRLGPYEILAPIRAGGMGEVYRAKDTTLGRDVAIKVLPQAVASEPDRVARLQREAQVLAALSHP